MERKIEGPFIKMPKGQPVEMVIGGVTITVVRVGIRGRDGIRIINQPKGLRVRRSKEKIA